MQSTRRDMFLLLQGGQSLNMGSQRQFLSTHASSDLWYSCSGWQRLHNQFWSLRVMLDCLYSTPNHGHRILGRKVLKYWIFSSWIKEEIRGFNRINCKFTPLLTLYIVFHFGWVVTFLDSSDLPKCTPKLLSKLE